METYKGICNYILSSSLQFHKIKQVRNNSKCIKTGKFMKQKYIRQLKYQFLKQIVMESLFKNNYLYLENTLSPIVMNIKVAYLPNLFLLYGIYFHLNQKVFHMLLANKNCSEYENF